jgi:hypothetical protein
VAAGVLDTLQEFGSMLATAVLGALLANRLATGLPIEAAVAAQQLPAQAQEPFVAAMTAAASGNLSVGAGQASDLSLSSGIPADLAGQIRAAADHAFAVAFTDAMRPTMLVPAIVVLLAAGAVLFVKAKGLGVAVVAAGNAAVASEGVAASEAAAVRGPAGGDAEERSVARRLPEDAS